MDKFSLTPFQKTDLTGFQEYIGRAFHPKYILGDPKYIDWQFSGGALYLAKAGGAIVGHFGFFDRDYKIGDRTEKLRTLINLFVLEPYRKIGIGALLAKNVFETPNPILVSGYTPLAQKLYCRLRPNWKEAGNLNRYFAVLDASAPLFNDYKIPKTTTFEGSGRELEIREMIEVPKDWEKFWQEVRKRYPITVERTAEYLNWRFLRHPFFKYSVLEARQKGKLAAYLVYRTEEDQGFKIARIIDFVAEKAAEKPLLSKFLELIKKAKCQAADFVVSGNLYKQSFLESGFFDTAGTDFEKFPILFSPISAKKTYINIAYDLPADLQECYFTKADGDQDRPNPR